MSNEAYAEQPPSLEEVPDLAARYLEASDEEPEHQKRLGEIEAELDELASTREEVVDDMGEDHYLVEDIDAEIQELEDEREELQKSTEDVAQLQQVLFRAAAEEPGFQLNEHWLNRNTLRALTHALYGTEEEKLVIADYELCTSDNVQSLDRMQKIRIKRDIVHLARDQFTKDERVADRWKEFEDSPAYQAFSVIARDPGVGPSEIAEAYDDKSNSTVRNWTSDLSDQEGLKMVYTPKQGKYHLSTVGKYYATHYANFEGDDAEVAEEDVGTEIGEESADKAAEPTDENQDENTDQVGLGNSVEAPENQPRGSTDADQSATLSESKTTEEKAEALFNDVSETRRTNE